MWSCENFAVWPSPVALPLSLFANLDVALTHTLLATAMPFSDLLGKPPIMDLIIYYLTPIPPKASSGITRQEYFGKDKEEYERLPDESAPGMTSRNGIRSDSLAKLMRVNIVSFQ